MIDEIIGYECGCEVYLSDIHKNWAFIGYRDKFGNVTFY